jgi:alpha-L-fucosidase
LAAWTAPARLARQEVPQERLAAREWFRDAKLGMFVHRGVYSQLGQGEWVMQNRSLNVPTYEWLASAFNPIKFDAVEWVSLAKAAGARYITITARHHDGDAVADVARGIRRRRAPRRVVALTG